MFRVVSMAVYNRNPFFRSLVSAVVRTKRYRTTIFWSFVKVIPTIAPSPSKGCTTMRSRSIPSGTGNCLGWTMEVLGGTIDPALNMAGPQRK